MQGEDALRTVESLRGQLLAERAASRAAKESQEIMSNRLKELEEKLMIEQKYRRKAEKKLSILKKKLESLNIIVCVNIPEDQSDHSSSSGHSETSCISSTAENADQTEKSKSDVNMERKSNANEDNHRSETVESEEKNKKGENEDSEAVDEVNNSMALVLVSLPKESRITDDEMKVDSESVRQVLGTLKQIRQNIETTMDRRRSFKVA